jgi:hypothetical protein
MEGRFETENASRGRLECAGPDRKRRFIRGLERGCKVRGRSGGHHRPSRGRRIRGSPKTRKRHNRKMRESGKPEDPSPATLVEREFGATRRFTAGEAGRCKSRGNPELHRRERRKMSNPGKPGDSSDGAAEGENSGKPENSPPAQLEDAGCEETRNLIGRLNGTMHGPSNLRVHHIETPETSVSGVFVFGAACRIASSPCASWRAAAGFPDKARPG